MNKPYYWESEIQVPRDRDITFNPMIIPKRKGMVDGFEDVTGSLYAKGICDCNLGEQN